MYDPVGSSLYGGQLQAREAELEALRTSGRFVPRQPWPTAGWHIYDRLLSRETSGAWYDEPGCPTGLELATAECKRRNAEYAARVEAELRQRGE